MRILFAGGGTGGHINPALAVANYIREREPETAILYVGGADSMEQRLVPAAGFEFRAIRVSGFQRKLSVRNIGRNIRALWRVLTATKQSKKIIREFSPDICMGTGGYVCGPILREAAKMGVPIVVHESNAFPGVTTKMLARYAKCTMLGVEDASKYLGDAPWELTGNPVRPQVIRADKAESRRELGLDDRPLILSFGGSLGARSINEAMADLLVRSSKDGRYQHIHGYGQYSRWMPALLAEKGIEPNASNIDVREYINNMDVALSAADLVICRAGAITLSELQAQGKAGILIPSPNVAENHQFHNAMAMVNRGAARIIEEKDLTPEKLTAMIDSIFENETTVDEIGKNASAMGILDANERIYQVILKVLSS